MRALSDFCFAHIQNSSTRIVKSVKFLLPNFGHFQLIDLERLKNDEEWLSDAHVTLSLLCVFYLFYSVSICIHLNYEGIVF